MQNRKVLALLVAAVLLTSFLTYVVAQSASNTFTISSGVYPGAPSYTVWEEDGTYFAKNAYGVIVYSGTDASTVIQNAWSSMSTGGEIKLSGLIDLSSTGLVFDITKETTSLKLVGESQTNTIISYDGTGYAINITTSDAAVGFYNVYLSDFTLQGETYPITSGNNGLLIEKVGRIATVDRLNIVNFDYGLTISDTNTVNINNVKMRQNNYGAFLEEGTTSAPNAVRFSQCYFVSNDAYALYSTHYMGSFTLRDSVIELNQGGIHLNSYGKAVVIDGCYFENLAGNDIFLGGDDATYRINSVTVSNCKSTSGAADYFIYSRYVWCLTVMNCDLENHDASIYYTNNNQDFTLINVKSADTALFEAAATVEFALMPGLVIEPRRTGIIVINDSGGTLAEGDVVFFTGYGKVQTTTTANQDSPAVVMKGGDNGKPVVIAVSGVTPITVAAATSVGDTLVTYTSAKQATTNNAQTDPKKIIGYCVGGTTGAGSAKVLIK